LQLAALFDWQLMAETRCYEGTPAYSMSVEPIRVDRAAEDAR